ncbi:BA14K family protein [Sphingobium yanoikuyae]
MIGLALAIGSAAPASAQSHPDDRHPRSQQSQRGTDSDRRQPRTEGRGRSSPYGEWKDGWGSRPPAPPKHFTRKSDWNRHVRACQQRYRSYSARTDNYRMPNGKARRCTL